MDEQRRPLNAAEVFAECEKLWADGNARETVRRMYDEARADFHSQVMALDDDPTGVQTVHGISVVTDWKEETLSDAMGEGRMFFVLTNSRSFSAEKTAEAHREIAANACRAAKKAGKTLTVISRGDSTLRGHYPLETETLRRALEENGHPAFAGDVLCPFFREGGRFTLNGVHYVKEGEALTPAAQTEFARDKTFGYRHSFLPEYIEEKSGGRVRADQVMLLTLAEDVKKCVDAGAGMCHLHCRRPDGSLTPDTAEFIDTFEEILRRTDVVVQASTGGISHMTIEERCHPLDYWRVESSSLNGGSTNLNGGLYVNTDADIDYCAKQSYDRGIIPEVEVFDIGMIYNIERSAGRTPCRRPIIYNLVFGHQGGMQPDSACLTAFRSAVPADARWGVTHYGRDNWDFLAGAMALGASVVRIGFEDSAYLAPGEYAQYNWQVVERLTRLIHAMGLETADPWETRGIMGILPKKPR